MICPQCNENILKGAAVVINKSVGDWSVGDLSYIIYESGEFVDVEGCLQSVQRIKAKYLLCFDCGKDK